MASIDQEARPVSTGRALGRGFTAAHGALLGAVYLALLHAPLQVTNAFWQSVQSSTFNPEREPDADRVALALGLAGLTLAFGLVVFFVFPLVQGGILGQVRDRLEAPGRPARSFGAYARANYTRLLGSQGLFLLITIAVVFPAMILAVALALPDAWASSVAPNDQAQVNRQLVQHPAVIATVLVSMLVLSAAGMVYWMANCVVVAERESTLAAWVRGFSFCCRNVPAVLAVWLVNLAAGVILAPLGMLGQFGIVTEWWALAALAVLYAVATGYWGVVLAGICMALFLSRPVAAETAAVPVGAER
jgi:hypothetical protein